MPWFQRGGADLSIRFDITRRLGPVLKRRHSGKTTTSKKLIYSNIIFYCRSWNNGIQQLQFPKNVEAHSLEGIYMMSLKLDRVTRVYVAKRALLGITCALLLSLNSGIAYAAPVDVTNNAVKTFNNLDNPENLFDADINTGATFLNGGKFHQSTVTFDFSSSGGVALSKVKIYKLNGDENWDVSLFLAGSNTGEFGPDSGLGELFPMYLLPGNSWYEIDTSQFGAYKYYRLIADGDTPGYGFQNVGEIQLWDQTP